MDLKRKNFLIAGLGRTGIETIKFLIGKGAKVKATDINSFDILPNEISELIDSGLEVETGKHSENFLNWSDIVILSPGISFNTQFVKEAIRKNKEVISEIELAQFFITKPIIAITGSNGKTTTTSLISSILENNNYKVFTGGNIGIPLITIADKDQDFDYIVLELSSFQLQGTKSFKPYVAIFLNISPNHLDHHANFEEYLNSKMKIFKNQNSNEWAIINRSNENIENLLSDIGSNIVSFGNIPDSELKVVNKEVHTRKNIYDLSKIKLIGAHNLENAMCAIAVSEITNCNKEKTIEAITNFKSLPHRIEFVKNLNGVKIYNDSKSTSPGATLKALESITSPIILLAGGKDKGISFEILKETVNKKVKHLILFGESKFRMKEQIGKCVNTTVTNNLKDAVNEAISHSSSEDSILLSPACSSFDMFTSYEERGKEFKEIVKNI